ncbi:MAG: AAA family ATPase [Bacilli bacterium]|nr:AAA family ATPase [Bacilli bacterium]
MLYRKFLEKLVYWKEHNVHTPLMLIGARQTGKTYILKYFCENYFPNYIYINFDEQKEYVNFFKKNLNPERIITDIETYIGKKIDIDNTIIFFDEIQVSEDVIASLKYFNESNNNYKIVCAGSLLGVKINRFQSSFPVGKVYFEYLYPLDFEEFLISIGEKLLNKAIKESYLKMEALSEPLHEKAITLYKHYLCVGGMPASILEYLNKNKDLVLFDKNIQSNIITAYLADMAKYTERAEAVKTYEIYNSIPEQLTKENKKFVYKVVNPKAKNESYASSIDWLLQSGLLLKCIRIKRPEKPLKIYEEKNIFKIYLSDVGLLTNLSKFNYYDIIHDEGKEFRGILSENYVAQVLKMKGYDLNYWTGSYTSEVDFILNIENAIIPVEVKASSNTRSYSLTFYMKEYTPPYAIRLSLKNFGFTNNIKSIPLYAAHLL